MTRSERIAQVLRDRFAPLQLEVRDDSARHAGHAGAAPGGETHFHVVLISESFRDSSRVARSRAVHAALEHEFTSGLHALSLILGIPEERP